jgi:hypothetical protein
MLPAERRCGTAASSGIAIKMIPGPAEAAMAYAHAGYAGLRLGPSIRLCYPRFNARP